jgi:hypothetical protein
MHDFKVGQMIHGFAGGAYGRDSYDCRRVEAVGFDWVVTRNSRGEVEIVSGHDIPSPQTAASRDHCLEGCTG